MVGGGGVGVIGGSSVLFQIGCAGFWMVIDIITGMVGNYIRIGVP